MATQHVKDSRELVLFLEQRGLAHYTDLLLRSGYTYNNLHAITADDLTKLRITNKKERESVTAAIEALKEEQKLPADIRRARKKAKVLDRSGLLSASRSRQDGGANTTGDNGESGGVQMRTLADGTVTMTVEGVRDYGFDAFTANAMTANECAREAALFLDHHNISRPWPRPGSKLAQSLNLTNATPKSHDPIYSINLGDETQVVAPPCHHTTGYQAKFCKICVDFVQEGMQGQWQYQQIETITIGDGLTEQVAVWKPFEQAESLKIEYANKRKEPAVKIRGKLVDFAAMRWGPTKPVRRVNRDTVPFPTLKRRDIVTAPALSDLPQQQLQAEIFDLTKLLVSDTEERKSRIRIEQEEQRELLDVLARIQAIMEDYFAQQRAQLEDEEAAARARIEGPEYEAALDALCDFEEESVRDVAVQQMAKQSEEIWAKQYNLLEAMEAQVRAHIEAEEAAMRENLQRLVNLLNAQCYEMLNRAKQRIQVQNDGKLRCPVCRKLKCTFHKNPWHNHWKHRGGALDMHARVDGFDTLSQLMGRAGEREYQECVLNMKAERAERKAGRRLRSYLGLNYGTDASFVSPQKIDAAAEEGGVTPPPPPAALRKPPPSATHLDAGLDPSMHMTASPIGARPSSAMSTRSHQHQQHQHHQQQRPSTPKPFYNAAGPGFHISADSVSRLSKRKYV